jgi:hypothetical protein
MFILTGLSIVPLLAIWLVGLSYVLFWLALSGRITNCGSCFYGKVPKDKNQTKKMRFCSSRGMLVWLDDGEFCVDWRAAK